LGSPLAIAAHRGDLETAKALLALGASTDTPNLAKELFIGDRRLCSDSAQHWPDAERLDVPKYLAVADLLVEHGLRFTPEAIQTGKNFCRGADNAMVMHLESRMNMNLGR